MTRSGRVLVSAAWLVLALAAGAVPCLAQDSSVASDHEMLHTYVWSTLGPEGLRRATLAANFYQWREDPPEWGMGAAGYAQRWASSYAKSAIGNTAKYGVAHALHQDPSFTKCGCSGFARRLLHAIDSPFMARTRDGRRVASPASLAGVLASRMSASTWSPGPHGARDELKRVGTSVVSLIAVDVFKEFWPRRRK